MISTFGEELPPFSFMLFFYQARIMDLEWYSRVMIKQRGDRGLFSIVLLSHEKESSLCSSFTKL